MGSSGDKKMKYENKIKMIAEFEHFCKCINFKKSWLDCRAIRYMNEFSNYLGEMKKINYEDLNIIELKVLLEVKTKLIEAIQKDKEKIITIIKKKQNTGVKNE